MSLTIVTHSKCIKDCVCKLIHLRIILTIIKFLNYNDTLLIYCCDKVFALSAKKTLHALHGTVIFLLRHLKNHYYTAHVCFNMQFLCTVVNIYKEQIVKKQVFNKAVFVKAFFIRYDQILNLKSSKLADHISIFIVTMSNQNVFKLIVITDLKILEALYQLTVRL